MTLTNICRRPELVYFGTGELGISRKDYTDLYPFSEDSIRAFKSRDRKKLGDALSEAEKAVQ